MNWRRVSNIRKVFTTICNYSTQDTKQYVAGYRPRRSLLYVPGSEKRKMKKATSLKADVIVLDLEDGVAENMKATSRDVIKDCFPSLKFQGQESAIRMNSIETIHADEDLDFILNMPVLPDAIMIPKIDLKDHVMWFNSKVKKHLSRGNVPSGAGMLKIIGMCETATGFMNLRDILIEASKDDNEFIKFEAFVFGSDDFLASIGGRRTEEARELLFARQYFVMMMKGFGFQAIDMVDIEFHDLDGLRKQCIEGAAMGFTGKQVIHPNQIEIVNASFSPSAEEVDFARRLVDAFHKHQEEGKGAFAFEGKMIDMPSLKQAQNVLNSTMDT